jgi:hypothetical protein
MFRRTFFVLFLFLKGKREKRFKHAQNCLGWIAKKMKRKKGKFLPKKRLQIFPISSYYFKFSSLFFQKAILLQFKINYV